MYKNMNTLRRACCKCQKCALNKTRIQVVFGDGDVSAAILFVGEAPGANEDREGHPFIGRGGKLMHTMMEAAGIDPSTVFITNMVKCRPPENRDPSPEEQTVCRDWLNEQIRILNPKIIVCIGRIAAMNLIRNDYKVTKEHGVFYNKDGRTYMGMFHPAAVLRSPRLKDAAQEDFYRLKAYLEQAFRK